jgi:hypothetical protein
MADPADFVGKCATLPGAVAAHEPQSRIRLLTRPRFPHVRGSAKRGGIGPGVASGTTNLFATPKRLSFAGLKLV